MSQSGGACRTSRPQITCCKKRGASQSSDDAGMNSSAGAHRTSDGNMGQSVSQADDESIRWSTPHKKPRNKNIRRCMRHRDTKTPETPRHRDGETTGSSSRSLRQQGR
eukprot:1162150-Pelagomonas_calceolata.AAC.16